MRASPAFQFVLSRFGWWRAGIVLLAGAALAVMIAWLAARSEPLPPAALAAWSAGLIAIPLLALSAMRVKPVLLRWDGRSWWLAPPRRHGDAQAGEIEVALDLGAWMLLRFHPSASDGRSRWLPVQRRGLEPHWHALRCAVYCAGPAPARDAAGQP